ncbi:MAG: response regulator [Candidatus Saganbacteria bacterium]|nr:response regulator [Candidatus Saganbacteria bacterium]
MKILIADDEELVRSSLEGILKKVGGFEVDFAFDGEEALKKIGANFYDAAILDLVMPKLDGYAALTRIREIHPDLPVIFITGKATEAKKIKESITHHNLNGFIEKPFSPEGVLDVISKAARINRK